MVECLAVGNISWATHTALETIVLKVVNGNNLQLVFLESSFKYGEYGSFDIYCEKVYMLRD